MSDTFWINVGGNSQTWLHSQNKDHTVEVIRKDAITPALAAEVLLGDDFILSAMAKALHDGPMGADDYTYSAATEQGKWCLDAVRAPLKAIAQQGESE